MRGTTMRLFTHTVMHECDGELRETRYACVGRIVLVSSLSIVSPNAI